MAQDAWYAGKCTVTSICWLIFDELKQCDFGDLTKEHGPRVKTTEEFDRRLSSALQKVEWMICLTEEELEKKLKTEVKAAFKVRIREQFNILKSEKNRSQ